MQVLRLAAGQWSVARCLRQRAQALAEAPVTAAAGRELGRALGQVAVLLGWGLGQHTGQVPVAMEASQLAPGMQKTRDNLLVLAPPLPARDLGGRGHSPSRQGHPMGQVQGRVTSQPRPGTS